MVARLLVFLWIALTGFACGRGHEDVKPAFESSGDGPAPAGHAGSAAGPSFDALMKSYSSWTKRMPEPLAISAEIWALCRLPSPAEQAFVESKHGAGLYLLDWVNPQAAQGLAAGGKPGFPVGAAIVKEKLMRKDDAKLEVVALGLMIKRSPGFDPAHGDWEFGYWEAASGLQTGAEPARACGGCHASSKTDFVFADASWRTPPSSAR